MSSPPTFGGSPTATTASTPIVPIAPTASTSIVPIAPTASTSIVPTFTPVSSQASTTSATTSILSATSSATSNSSSASSSRSSQEVQGFTSTTGSQSSTSSNHTSAPGHSSSVLPNHRLSNGTVAGIVVGVALGLALITFLVTCAFMRRQRQSKSKKRSRLSGDRRGVELRPPRYQGWSGASPTNDNYFPQSADDKTIQQKVRSTLDQIELHVENFYRNPSSSALRPDNRELALFDSPYLSASLASLLPHSRNEVNIIKHALAQSVISSLSLTADSKRSLIPTEYTLLPSAITSTKSSVTLKPGKCHFRHMQIHHLKDVANATKNSPR